MPRRRAGSLGLGAVRTSARQSQSRTVTFCYHVSKKVPVRPSTDTVLGLTAFGSVENRGKGTAIACRGRAGRATTADHLGHGPAKGTTTMVMNRVADLGGGSMHSEAGGQLVREGLEIS